MAWSDAARAAALASRRAHKKQPNYGTRTQYAHTLREVRKQHGKSIAGLPRRAHNGMIRDYAGDVMRYKFRRSYPFKIGGK